MDFHAMKRDELRELCKKHKIPANLKNIEMANRLASLFKIDNEKPKEQKLKSCLKNLDDERNSEGKEDKKVSISAQNQTFEFEKTNPREKRLAYRTRKSMVRVEDEINNEEKESELVSVDNQVKSTRTRGRKPKLTEVVEAELLPKKKAEENDVSKRTSRKRTSVVADLVGVRPEKAVKNTAFEAKPVTRRSAKNAEKPVDSVEQVEIVKVPKRKTRSDCSENNGEEKATTRCLRRNTSKDTGERAVEEAKEQEKEKAKVTRNTRRQKKDTGLNETVSAIESASAVEQCQQRRSTRVATKRGKVEPEELNDKKSDAEIQERGVSLRNKQPRKQENSRNPGKSDVQTKCVRKRKLSTVKHVEDFQTDSMERSVDISEAVDIQNVLCKGSSAVEDDQGKNQTLHQTTSPTLLPEECEFRNAEERFGGISASTEFKELAKEEAMLNTESSSKNDVSGLQPENSDGETTKADEKDVDTVKAEEYNEAEILNGVSSEDAEIVLLPSSGFKSLCTEGSKAEVENSASKVDNCVQCDTPLTSTSIHKFTQISLPVCEPGFQGIYETQDETAIQSSLIAQCEPINGEVSLIKITDLEEHRLCADTILSNEQVQLTCTNGIVDSAAAKENQSGDVSFISRDEGIVPDFSNQEGQILSNDIADLKFCPALNELQSKLHEPADTLETSSMVSNEPVDSQADKCIDHLGNPGKSVGYIQDTGGVTPKAMVDEIIERSEGIDTCINDRSDDPVELERNYMQEFVEESNLQTNGIAAEKDSVVISNEPQLNDSHEDADLADQNLKVHEEKAGNILGNMMDSEEVLPSATVEERAKGIDTFSSDNSDDIADCEGSHKLAGSIVGNIQDGAEVIPTAMVERSEEIDTCDSSDDTADNVRSHKQELEDANSQLISGEETYDIASLFQSEYAEDDVAVINNELKGRNLIGDSDVELNNNNEDAVLAHSNMEVYEENGESCRETHEESGRLDDEDVCMEEAALTGLIENSIPHDPTCSTSPSYNSKNDMELVADIKKLGEFSSAGYTDKLAIQQSAKTLNDDEFIDEAGQSDHENLTEIYNGSTEPINMQGCGHMNHTEDESREEKDSVVPNVHLLFPCQNADARNIITQEDCGKVVSILEDIVTGSSEAAEDYESNAKNKVAVNDLESSEEKLDIQCSMEKANISVEHAKCDGSRANVELIAPSPEALHAVDSANQTELEDDLIGLVVVERIAEQTELKRSGENLSLTPEPQEADGENFSLTHEPEKAVGEKFSLPEPEEADRDNLSYTSEVEGTDGMNPSLRHEAEGAEGDNYSLGPELEGADTKENEEAQIHNQYTSEDSESVLPCSSALKNSPLEKAGEFTPMEKLNERLDGVCVDSVTSDIIDSRRGFSSAGYNDNLEPEDDPMDCDDYGSNAKNQAELIVLQGLEENSAIQSSVEEVNIRDENANYNESRATVELIAPSPEALLPVDSANQTEPEDDLIGLVNLERIAGQTEQQSSGEKLSLTSEPQEGDGEDFSLAPKPEEADGENFSLAPKPEEAVGEKFSLSEPEEANGENFSLLEPEEADGKNLSFTPQVEGADGKNFSLEADGKNLSQYEETQIHNQYISEDSESVLPCSRSLKKLSSEEAGEVSPMEKINERLEGVSVDSLSDIKDYKDGSVGSNKQGLTKESNLQLFGHEDTNCGILESKARLCQEGESIQSPGLVHENSESMEIELTSYEIALFMGDDYFGDKAGTLDSQTSEMNLMTCNMDVSQNKECQIDTEQVESDDIYEQGCDSSELTLVTSAVCDKDESVHQKDDVPTGDFFVPCQAKHEDLSHPEQCTAFEEVTGKTDPVSEDENAFIDQAKEDALDLMNENSVETLEGGNEEMEALVSASFPEMRSVKPDEYKNAADVKGVSNEDLFQGSKEECLSRSVFEANPTAENMESDDLGVTFQRDAPLPKEDANMHENSESMEIELTSYETALFMGDDNIGDIAGTLDYRTSEMNLMTCNMDVSQNKEDQIDTKQVESDDICEQGCDSSELTLLTSVVYDKDESVHQKEDVPTGNFFEPCQAKHEDLSHPVQCTAFEEVTGKTDLVSEDENAFINQAKEDVLDLMNEDSFETLEGGKGISNEDLFHGSKDECLRYILTPLEANPTAENMECDDLGVTFQIDAPLPKEDANMHGISKEREITSQLEMKKPLDNEVEDAKLDTVENSSRKPNSAMNMKNRSIMIHGTPRRPIKVADMKENSTAHLKREHHLADATAMRPIARRKALMELHRR